ncbi:MAG: hypothetical protein J4G06_04365 [Caldilineaceae bacterium]|nr:hypothetical protein [Caldilineaceae bacterium]
MTQVLEQIWLLGLWWLNGLLAVLWTALDNGPLLTTFGVSAFMVRMHPSEPRQRAWLWAACLLSALAAGLAPAPVPVLMAVMAVAGVLAVRLDRFNPEALRWRVAGGLTLYALASLGYLAYSHYLGVVDARQWAAQLGGATHASRTLEQLATWGLWLILPLGYMSLLVQGLLIHPPTSSPVETINTVRTRGHTRTGGRPL